MLKDFLVNFTKQYHELGHTNFLGIHGLANSEAVNKMIDSASGLGHRLKAGHSFDGLLHSIEIDGIHGATSWFDHMLKDFTSPDGIPIPGAMFIKDITGMDYSHAVDWLCINASDVIELGVMAAAVSLLEKKIKDKPQIKNVAVALGGCIGIADDNPLLVAYFAIQAAKVINEKYKIVSDQRMANLKVFSRNCYRGLTVVSIGTFFTGVAAQAFFDTNIVDLTVNVVSHAADGISTIGEHLGLVHDAADHVDTAATIAEGAGHFIDGIATLGLGLAASYGIRKIFKYVNNDVKERVTELYYKVTLRRQIRDATLKQLPPNIVAGLLTEGLKNDCYKSIS
jgi:hypothetical protein